MIGMLICVSIVYSICNVICDQIRENGYNCMKHDFCQLHIPRLGGGGGDRG